MVGRPLLHSEFAILQSAYANSSVRIPPEVCVLREEYATSRVEAPRLFNADFSLWLLPDLPMREDRIVEVVPVRPHSMGAEYFLTIRNDGSPALMELIGGASIPFESFAEAISRVEVFTSEVLRESCANVPYLRLAELTTGISFLAAKMRIEELTRLPPEHKTINKCQFSTRRLNGEAVMIDGFIEN